MQFESENCHRSVPHTRCAVRREPTLAFGVGRSRRRRPICRPPPSPTTRTTALPETTRPSAVCDSPTTALRYRFLIVPPAVRNVARGRCAPFSGRAAGQHRPRSNGTFTVSCRPFLDARCPVNHIFSAIVDRIRPSPVNPFFPCRIRRYTYSFVRTSTPSPHSFTTPSFPADERVLDDSSPAHEQLPVVHAHPPAVVSLSTPNRTRIVQYLW